MTDWQLWREDFAQGYVDYMDGKKLCEPTNRDTNAYLSGYTSAMKVKEALKC